MNYVFENQEQLLDTVAIFQTDYGMYVDWCNSLYSNQGVQLLPVSINQYMAVYYTHFGV